MSLLLLVLLLSCLRFVYCSCTAFIIQITVDEAARPKTCRLVYGIYDVAEFKRSFVRATSAACTTSPAI